jgi:hypothetical protein
LGWAGWLAGWLGWAGLGWTGLTGLACWLVSQSCRYHMNTILFYFLQKCDLKKATFLNLLLQKISGLCTLALVLIPFNKFMWPPCWYHV